MKKFIMVTALVAMPVIAQSAAVTRAPSANNLPAVTTTSSYTGLSQRNIFTTYHDPAKVNSDQGNVNEDYKQLNQDLNNGDAQSVAADKNQIASDRAKVSGDYSTYNSANNKGIYSGINSPVVVTHTDEYHENSYRHHHVDENN